MPLTTRAGFVNLVREQSTGVEDPPVIFPDIHPGASQGFSFCIWVKAYSLTSPVVFVYACSDGSDFHLGTLDNSWVLSARNQAIGLPNMDLGNIVPGWWTLYCFVKNGPTLIAYRGLEHPPDVDNPSWENPVELVEVDRQDYFINSQFSYLSVIPAAGRDICNFKFWNHVLTREELQSQANTWGVGGLGPAPIWASPLRTPGDISNIANPTALHWDEGHAYTILSEAGIRLFNISNIGMGGPLNGWRDPAYMTTHEACPTWIYPAGDGTWVTQQDTRIFVDPGMTPFVPTNYKGPQFYQFEDRGSVQADDGTVQSIRYYGLMSGGPDPGVPASDTWGLYKDENGVQISSPIPSNSFKTTGDAGVTIPGDITATNMYRWQFGAEFNWQPVTPQAETETANLYFLKLYVLHLGFPSGVPLLSLPDLSGLFILNNKGVMGGEPNLDIYNNSVRLRIPDPVVRTALIGE